MSKKRSRRVGDLFLRSYSDEGQGRSWLSKHDKIALGVCVKVTLIRCSISFVTIADHQMCIMFFMTGCQSDYDAPDFAKKSRNCLRSFFRSIHALERLPVKKIKCQINPVIHEVKGNSPFFQAINCVIIQAVRQWICCMRCTHLLRLTTLYCLECLHLLKQPSCRWCLESFLPHFATAFPSGNVVPVYDPSTWSYRLCLHSIASD